MEHDSNPACEVRLHEVSIVLFDLRQYVPLAHLVQLVLDALNDLPHNEVLVNEYEEETFEESIDAQESKRGHGDEDLSYELAEELGFVQYVLVQLRQLL